MVAFGWELPTRGDNRHVGSAHRHRGGWGPSPTSAVATDLRPGRLSPFDAVDQIITAAETSGYDEIVAPYDPGGEESWVVAGHALRRTRHARVAVEFHPAFGTPVYAAKVSSTLQRFSAGRVSWQLIVETDPADNRARGDLLSTEGRYRRADEFLTVAKGVWSGAGASGGGFSGGEFNHVGEFYEVIDGGLDKVIDGHPFPRLQTTGNVSAALDLAARHADVHIFELPADGSPPGVDALAARAVKTGRTVACGVALPLIARATTDEAERRLVRQWREVYGAGAESELNRLRVDDLTFAGFDRIGHRHPVGLVGSYDAVAQRIKDLKAAGIEHFVLSGIPHIEEVYRNAEHLLFLADERSRVLA